MVESLPFRQKRYSRVGYFFFTVLTKHGIVDCLIKTYLSF
nr:MAG TPA: hypothetical protein [Caudoviricetes sp.]